MATARNPLSGLPSVLAIRDLRRRVRNAIRGSDSPAATRLLALDPPAALRCMRAAAAPAYGARPKAWTIEGIVELLGPSLARRALDVPPKDISGTGPLRQLWLHAVATAMAARSLASATGMLDPEEAYLLGLVHDISHWLRYLGLRQGGTPTPGPAEEWIRHWDLPAQVADPLTSLAEESEDAPVTEPRDPATLVRAAEFLAELADFWHPDGADAGFRQAVLGAASREDLLCAQHLRHEVHAALHAVGLDSSEPQHELEQGEPMEDFELYGSQRRGDVSEVILSILSCSKAASYRSIITATTAAALRFLDYDRALVVKWVRERNEIVVRTKADLSPRRTPSVSLTPTAIELEAMQRSHEEERPVRAEAKRLGPPGLQRWMGADEILFAPLNRDFKTPSFLVLDRAITTRPILMLQDTELASTLVSTGSLLIENLLLKRRRQRAQKFALTDPLTRLNNRSTGMKGLEQEIVRSQRTQRPMSALMVDLDDFKGLNDAFGHLRGDQALRSIAEVMRQTVRRSDTVCRYGGEEFLVVLPETGPDEAAVLAARLATAAEARGQKLGLPLTVSIGMAAARPDDTVETLLQRADQALYASKALGRNRFSIDVDS